MGLQKKKKIHVPAAEKKPMQYGATFQSQQLCTCEYILTPLVNCFLAGWHTTLIVEENLSGDTTVTIMATSVY